MVAEDAHLEESRECLPNFLQEAHLSAIRLHAARLVRKASSSIDKTELWSKKNSKKDLQGQTAEEFQEVKGKKQKAESKPQKHLSSKKLEEDQFPPSVENPDPPTEAPVEEEEEEPTEAPTEAPVEEEEEEEVATPSTGVTAALDAAGFKEITSLCCPPEMEQFFNRLLASMGYDVCSKPHIQGLMHWFTCVPDMDFQYMLDVIANGNPCKYWTSTGASCPAISDQCAGKFCR